RTPAWRPRRRLRWRRPHLRPGGADGARRTTAWPEAAVRIRIVATSPRSRARVDVTIAVATLDRPDSLSRCLDAILSGAMQPHEIVVVDQGSDRRSETVVRDREDAGVPVRYLRDSASGLSASRNAALAAAETDVVATTDDDCVPGPAWLPAIADAFSGADPPVAVTGPVLPLGDEADG